MSDKVDTEAERILAEYDRRRREIPTDFYALHRPANLFIRHGQERALRRALANAGLLPLENKRLLEVGCGHGDGLMTAFEDFGLLRENIAGIELDAGRAALCARRFVGAEIRVGNAAHLPWPDQHFDMVFQSTVFTSILDPAMKQAVAGEMLRVLKRAGCILWYDFLMNNPSNPHVRGIGRRELTELFPGCNIEVQRVTLAPPLARRVVPLSWTAARLLEKLRLLNTHYFAVLRRKG
jgi:ubiquinone/menaquinone biosynthesis C-methylase UbiE